VNNFYLNNEGGATVLPHILLAAKIHFREMLWSSGRLEYC